MSLSETKEDKKWYKRIFTFVNYVEDTVRNEDKLEYEARAKRDYQRRKEIRNLTRFRINED